MTEDRHHLPVGLFDSGVGGLTVFHEVRRRLPAEHLVYLGDTARVPYGTKGADTVRRYSVGVAQALMARRCKAIVIACNTASAFAVDAVRDAVDVPVIDVIEPVAQAVARAAGGSGIGVLGTRGTVSSQAYPRALARHGQADNIAQQACPLFVPLAEEGWTDGPVPEQVAETYLTELFAQLPARHLILGCTHYPLLRDVITRVARRIAEAPVDVYDSAVVTADALERALRRANLLRQGDQGSARFLVTDDPAAFLRVAHRFVDDPVEHVEHIDL